jgi:tetratricopeptide (TPR) repeat protein
MGLGPVIVALLVTFGVVAGPATAWAEAPSREQALEALANRADPDLRRHGARWLGETGTMADLPRLAEALRDDDSVVRALAEQAMWQVWSRSGDAEIDRLLAVGIEQMQERRLDIAVETFSRIIQQRPDFAEGWNKRATVHYLMGDYSSSLADCDQVMKRNAFHFGALSGYGMIYLQQSQPERALEYFERALAVNPNLHQVELAVDQLRRLLQERRRQTT